MNTTRLIFLLRLIEFWIYSLIFNSSAVLSCFPSNWEISIFFTKIFIRIRSINEKFLRNVFSRTRSCLYFRDIFRLIFNRMYHVHVLLSTILRTVFYKSTFSWIIPQSMLRLKPLKLFRIDLQPYSCIHFIKLSNLLSLFNESLNNILIENKSYFYLLNH